MTVPDPLEIVLGDPEVLLVSRQCYERIVALFDKAGILPTAPIRQQFEQAFAPAYDGAILVKLEARINSLEVSFRQVRTELRNIEESAHRCISHIDELLEPDHRGAGRAEPILSNQAQATSPSPSPDPAPIKEGKVVTGGVLERPAGPRPAPPAPIAVPTRTPAQRLVRPRVDCRICGKKLCQRQAPCGEPGHPGLLHHTDGSRAGPDHCEEADAGSA